PVRLALGSLMIKEKLGLSDDETVLASTENPYLQYFIGLHVFQEKAPFDPSSMTHFRKRFDADFINNLNERIVRAHQEAEPQNHSKDDPPNHDDNQPSGGTGRTTKTKENQTTPPSTQGNLLLDATCAPSDIAYPTYVNLLYEA